MKYYTMDGLTKEARKQLAKAVFECDHVLDILNDVRDNVGGDMFIKNPVKKSPDECDDIYRTFRGLCALYDGCECTVRSRDKCNGCGWNPREQRRRKAYDKDPINFDPWIAREGLRELEIQKWRRAHGFVDPVEEAEKEQEYPEEDPSEPEDETKKRPTGDRRSRRSKYARGANREHTMSNTIIAPAGGFVKYFMPLRRA